MNARIAAPAPATATSRNLRASLERAGMALIGGSHDELVPQFGRCYGRSSGYASTRRYAPLTAPALLRCR